MSSMYGSLLTVWHDALALAMAESMPTSSLLVRLAPFFRRLRLIHRCTVMPPASTIAVPVAAGYFPVPGYFSEMLFILLFISSIMASAVLGPRQQITQILTIAKHRGRGLKSFPGARFKKVG
ncbi:hypothetical protein N7501_004542 [Penicillium viridicatum]|nr:hypothetical protein N7501_004542 [Penicillium viridicatum]